MHNYKQLTLNQTLISKVSTLLINITQYLIV